MRKALIVGIDYYSTVAPLYGCVGDAHRVRTALERHADGSINFANPKLLTASNQETALNRSELRENIVDLFDGQSDIALLYFAGHGHKDNIGGYLCTSEIKTGNDGLSLHEIVGLANKSPAKNKIIILDSCHAGIAANHVTYPVAELSDGLTILAASTADQYASEENGTGIFTDLLVDALNGAASNLVGDITPGSIYAHIDQSLGPWGSRPVFKTNVAQFVSLRKATAPISLTDLQSITEYFPEAGYEFHLDPSYEPESSAPNPEHTSIFRMLQKYARVNLLVPVGAEHMYYAAMESKSCKLTVTGEHYRRLVEANLI